MLRWIKFILKLNLKQQIVLKEIIDKILNGDLSGLDITKIVGKKNFYRCRNGKVRIVFYKKGGKYFIDDVDFRGRIYKGY